MLVCYVLLLGHFILSNYVSVIGPHYVIPLHSFSHQETGFCPHSECVEGVCPEYFYPDPPPFAFKGFPFATNHAYVACGEWQEVGDPKFWVAQNLNRAYIILITAATIMYVYRELSHRKVIKA